MKRIFTLAASFLLIGGLSAQITGTLTDVGSIGDEVLVGFDTIPDPGQIVSAAGPSQTWNYSNFDLMYWDTTRFEDPATLPNGNVFSSANLAITGGGAVQDNFVIADSTGISIVGISVEIGGFGNIPAALLDPLALFQFPMNYLDAWVDTGRIDTTFDDTFTGLADSLHVVRWQVVDAEIDGWGSLTTLNGTYDVLRMKTVEISLDTAWGLVPIFGWQQFATQSDTTYRYSFFANNEDYPVLDLSTTVADEIISASYQIGDQVIASAATLSNTTCNSDCDGSATVIAVGGTAPFMYAWDDAGNQTTATATGLCAGTYMATVTDGGGTSSIAMTTVTEPSVVNIDSLQQTNESHLGNDGQISIIVSGGSPGYAYEWSNGATTQNVDSLVGGPYTVTVTDNNGCTNTLDFAVSSAVGISENAVRKPNVSVWPVPANDYIVVKHEATGTPTASIYNLLGEVVRTERLSNATTRLDVSGLEEGVYFIKIGEGAEAAATRLVIAGN